MQLNPIIVREVRTRWRHWHGFALLCGYAALLAVAMCLLYADFMSRQQPAQDLRKIAPSGGHELFSALTVLQTFAWMLMAPALTATGIAGERERGLLEALHMSPLRTYQIVWGKLLPALLFVLLLTLVAMPISSICFLMGGVSPGEFGWALTLHAITAFTGASIGIYFSARSRRALGALTTTFVFLAIWGFGSLWLFESYSQSWRWRWNLGHPKWWEIALGVLGWSNPVLAALALVEPRPSGAGAMTGALLPPDYPVWTISFTLQALLSIILVRSAMRLLRKPLLDVMLGNRRWTDRWKERLARDKESQQTSRRQENAGRLAGRAGGVLLWDLPLAGFIRFANPVLQREVRGQFRWRRGSLWVTLLQAALGLAGMCTFIYAAYSALDPLTKGDAWWALSYLMLLLLIVAAALSGARSFTREREAGTWGGLYLSLLSPREILTGKILAPLIGFSYYSLPLWPAMALCVDYTHWNHIGQVSRWPGAPAPSVSLSQALAAVCILAAAGWCYAAWGMLMSRLSRNTTTATVWTLGTLFFALVCVPPFLESSRAFERIYYIYTLFWNTDFDPNGFGYGYWHELVSKFVRLWHPGYALNSLHTPDYVYPYPYSPYGGYYAGATPVYSALPGFANAAVLFVTGWVLLAILSFLMRGATFEKERRRSRHLLFS
jgi:ABC-type transport system involved in multi-copper enzyme maturation permease subunit